MKVGKEERRVSNKSGMGLTAVGEERREVKYELKGLEWASCGRGRGIVERG